MTKSPALGGSLIYPDHAEMPNQREKMREPMVIKCTYFFQPYRFK